MHNNYEKAILPEHEERKKMKTCKKCGRPKPESEFYGDKRNKDGFRGTCKTCCSVMGKIYREGHIEEIKECNKRYRKENPEKARAYSKTSREKHPEEVKDRVDRWRKEHPEEIKKYNRKYKVEHFEAVKACSKTYWEAHPEKAREGNRKRSKRYLSIPKIRISHNMATSINQSITRGIKAGRHWETLVEYNIDELKKHLESLFKDGMAWHNYGQWEIDHKIPISVFNFEKPEDSDFRRCWSLKNLQPMWATENRAKSNKIDCQFQPAFMFG